MKILIWSQYFWPEIFKINQMATMLHKLGMKITVLTGKPNYPCGNILPNYRIAGVQYEIFSGIDVIRIPLLPRKKGSAIHLAINYLSFIFSGFIFAPIVLRREKIEVIFVYATSPLLQALPAIFVSWIKRVPLIIWVQDIWPEALESTGYVKNKCLLSIVRLFVRYIYRSADSILIQSEAFRESVVQYVHREDKIFYYPNSVEDIIQNIALKENTKSPFIYDMEQYFSVIFTGNIGTAQSCESILIAAEKLLGNQEIHFYLIGTGSQAESIAEKINQRKLTNVTMTGQQNYDSMPAIYAAASVLLVTLRRGLDLAATIPSKLQTYLAAGKPIIACLDGEAARIVRESNAGFDCPAEDAVGLANTIMKLYNMTSEERLKLGANGLNYYKTHFELKERALELVEHLKNIVVSNKRKKN